MEKTIFVNANIMTRKLTGVNPKTEREIFHKVTRIFKIHSLNVRPIQKISRRQSNINYEFIDRKMFSGSMIEYQQYMITNQSFI